MINGIIDFSLRNRMLVVLAWLLLAGLGLNAMASLPIDAVPDITNVQVQIITTSPGVAPEEIERFVTVPVEAAMSGMPKVEAIRSISRFGISLVTVVFEEGTNLYWARALVSERMAEVRGEIPEGYGEPAMGPISTGLGEIYQFELKGSPMCDPGTPDTDACYTPMELRSLLDWYVNFQLRSVAGVVEVNAFGGELKTYQVTVDPDKLVSRGISMKQLTEALGANNRNVGGGYIEDKGEQYIVRGEGLVQSLEDIGSIVLSRDENDVPVRVRDVASIEFAPMIRQGAVTRDGRGEAVVGIVMMLMGENSRTVVDRVKDRVALIGKGLPKGVTIDTFYDRTELIRRTIHTVAKNLVEGAFLVIVVLLLLLGNLRAGLIVAISIPLSMLVAFIGMRAMGLSGNLMSLGAIDFGLIVDGSVVMIENVIRVLHHSRPKEGEPPLRHVDQIRRAAHEVGRPVVFAVTIILIVYIPLLGLRGVEGKMFVPMALTVAFALGASLACALTLMPVLASFFLKNIKEGDPLLFRLASRFFQPALAAAERAPWMGAVAAGAIFAGGLALAPFLGAEFIPKLEEGSLAVQVWRLPSISLAESNRVSGEVERILRTFPEVETVISRTGSAEIPTDPMGVETSDTYVILKPPSEWKHASKESLIADMDRALEKNVPGAIFSYSQPIELRFSELISGVRSDVGIHIYGDDIAELKKKADEVVQVLQGIPGAADSKAEQTVGLPMLRIRIDRDAIARYGINASDVLDVVEAIGGKRIGEIVEGQKRFTFQVRFVPSVRDGLERIRNLRIAAPGNQGAGPRLIPLGQLASIAIEDGPAQISREKISRRINVEVNVRGRDLASFVTEAQTAVERKVKFPAGWVVEWGGQFQNLKEAVSRLMLLVPLALLLIGILLYTTFGSARLAIFIFLNVPVAVAGGILALGARGYPLSISAGVGFISLFGVGVLNGVILVSYIVQRMQEGIAPAAAAREGAEVRLRPILLTGMVAILGYVPMAIAHSAGAEVQRPLATVVIGGLVASTLFTLLVMPPLFSWFADRPRADVEL